MTKSIESQKRVHLNVKIKNQVIQERIEENIICSSGSIKKQFYQLEWFIGIYAVLSRDIYMERYIPQYFLCQILCREQKKKVPYTDGIVNQIFQYIDDK